MGKKKLSDTGIFTYSTTPLPILTTDKLYEKVQELAGLYLPKQPVDHFYMSSKFFVRPGEWKVERPDDDLFLTKLRFSFELPETRAIISGVLAEETFREKIWRLLCLKFGYKFMWKFWRKYKSLL
jgi:hypothetical protein